MKSFKNIILVVFGFLLLVFIFFGIRVYTIRQLNFESQNICQNDDLIAKLIVNNINPFSKFKFLKKRNVDCKVLLITNRDDAEKSKKQEFCSMIDASTNSVSMLIYAYVNEMYDRETASKELHQIVPLMVPYSYCSQYYENLTDLVTIKKRLGL